MNRLDNEAWGGSVTTNEHRGWLSDSGPGGFGLGFFSPVSTEHFLAALAQGAVRLLDVPAPKKEAPTQSAQTTPTQTSDTTNQAENTDSNPGGTIEGTSRSDAILGSSGDDLITGGNGMDIIAGNGGHDSIYGGNGADIIVTGNGNDTIDSGSGLGIVFGGNGKDVITGGNGLDILFGGNGADAIFGKGGADILFGGNGSDWLEGGDGTDILMGGNGNDTLIGGAGNDILTAGKGDDTYGYQAGAFGQDIINDESGGNDVLDMRTVASTSIKFAAVDSDNNGKVDQLTLTMANGDRITIQNFFNNKGVDAASSSGGKGLLESLVFKDGTFGIGDIPGLIAQPEPPAEAPEDPPTDPEDPSGGEDPTDPPGGEDPTAPPTEEPPPGPVIHTLTGGPGDDTFTFQDGFGLNVIQDPGGNDTVDFSAITTDMTINLNAGADSNEAMSDGHAVNWDGNIIEDATGGSGNDHITGNGEANILAGKDGNDWLWGDSGNDRLFGGNGHDTLTGGTGTDQLDGGAGDDTYIFHTGFGLDTIVDASGSDTLDLSSFTTGVTINLTTGTGSADGGASTLSGLTAMENVTGGDGNDILIGNAADNILIGGKGNDNINGLLGNDILDGGEGDDILTGGGGDEKMYGGTGNDTYIFKPGFGDDIIHDLSGTDVINLSSFNLGDVSSWSALDTDGNGFADSLLMAFAAGNSITVEHYLDNTAAMAAGEGLVETICFADDASVDFTQVQGLVG